MAKAPTVSEKTISRKLLGALNFVLLLPIALILGILALPFGRTIDRKPKEVVRYLRDFIDGTGEDWDWDDFVSIQIEDPRLEDIRRRASAYPDIDQAALLALLHEAELMASATR